MCLLLGSLWSPQRSVSPKMDSNRDQITFVFLSSANILGVGRLSFTFFSLFRSFFFFYRPSLQIDVLERLHVESEPGKFSRELQAQSVFMVRREANWLCRRPFPTVTHGANSLRSHPGSRSFTLSVANRTSGVEVT